MLLLPAFLAKNIEKIFLLKILISTCFSKRADVYHVYPVFVLIIIGKYLYLLYMVHCSKFTPLFELFFFFLSCNVPTVICHGHLHKVREVRYSSISTDSKVHVVINVYLHTFQTLCSLVNVTINSPII